MMPVIRISDAAFADLKNISTWLEVDTPTKTIDQLVRNEMERLGLERDIETESNKAGGIDDALVFLETPGLTFTRILSASIGGREVVKPNWSWLLFLVVQKVHAKGIEGERLVRELHVPAKVGLYGEEGYTFDPALGISIQGQSASSAWKEIERLADIHGILVEVEFQWRDNEKAEHPNRIGRMKAGR